jgi:uncharacterized protein YegL
MRTRGESCRSAALCHMFSWLLIPIGTACDNSFSAAGGGGPAAPQTEATPGANDPQAPSFGQRPEEGGAGIGSGSGGAGGGLDSSNATVCNGGGEVNVVLVFDNSGSQSSADLQSMRQGASSLISELSSLATQAGAPFIPYVSVVRFSNTATIGSRRWVNLKTNSGDASSDVNEATADDGGSTHYVQALQRVGDLFREKGASHSKANQRNFVVFLSDGEPDDEGSVRSSAQSIADQHGAAYIAIGTGGTTFTILKEMSGIISTNMKSGHSGQFFAAANQSAVSTTFRQVAERLKNLCGQN